MPQPPPPDSSLDQLPAWARPTLVSTRGCYSGENLPESKETRKPTVQKTRRGITARRQQFDLQKARSFDIKYAKNNRERKLDIKRIQANSRAVTAKAVVRTSVHYISNGPISLHVGNHKEPKRVHCATLASACTEAWSGRLTAGENRIAITKELRNTQAELISPCKKLHDIIGKERTTSLMFNPENKAPRSLNSTFTQKKIKQDPPPISSSVDTSNLPDQKEQQQLVSVTPTSASVATTAPEEASVLDSLHCGKTIVQEYHRNFDQAGRSPFKIPPSLRRERTLRARRNKDKLHRPVLISPGFFEQVLKQGGALPPSKTPYRRPQL